MLTNNEISTLKLSPTKKDFVQIWNELLEVASKLSERWDPTSTNESDPGIVLLKALTGIADKLNYNIDKNILEAYMPTAAQEESMRKLCDMLGYSVKYYRSATTNIKVKYNYPRDTDGYRKDLPISGLPFHKFMTISNADKDVNFVTINQRTKLLTDTSPVIELECIEGQLVQCETINEHNVVTLNQLSSNNRYYLPEVQIAENGIFVYNVATVRDDETPTDDTFWSPAKENNLNLHAAGSTVYKFGFDSAFGLPYLEFPSDISELIQDGLFIYYTRTSGANGNISSRILTQMELPTTGAWEGFAIEDFTVINEEATHNGANIETIAQAYSNFKKTVGTFDTLVTCRDYMNKIYSLMDSEHRPLVSNAIVSDIRTDINRSVTICTCNDSGIAYVEKSLLNDENGEKLIDHFDLLLYPFKRYEQLSNFSNKVATNFKNSFTPSSSGITTFEAGLADQKTLAHNLRLPETGDVVSINNYLRLNAIIATENRVTKEEEKSIIENIKLALANEFNLRKLDFGEEIPFDSLLQTMENADARIRMVALNEPVLYTSFSVMDSNRAIHECAVASDWIPYTDASASAIKNNFYIKDPNGNIKEGETHLDTDEAKKIYNKLVLRNILAGRVPLFKSIGDFEPSLSDLAYSVSPTIYEKQLPEGVEVGTEVDDCGRHEIVRGPFNVVLKDVNGNDISAKDGNGNYIYEEDENGDYRKDSEGNLITVKEKADIYFKTEEPYKLIYGGDDEVNSPANAKNINKISATCEIIGDPDADKTFSDVVLAGGEKIKFRAPNLITKTTYPAYVYYHLKLNTTTESAKLPNNPYVEEPVSPAASLKFRAGGQSQTRESRGFIAGAGSSISDIYGTTPSLNKDGTQADAFSVYELLNKGFSPVMPSGQWADFIKSIGADNTQKLACTLTVSPKKKEDSPITYTPATELVYTPAAEAPLTIGEIKNLFDHCGAIFCKTLDGVTTFTAKTYTQADIAAGKISYDEWIEDGAYPLTIDRNACFNSYSDFSSFLIDIQTKFNAMAPEEANAETDKHLAFRFEFEYFPLEKSKASISQWETALQRFFGSRIDTSENVFWRLSDSYDYPYGKYIYKTGQKLLPHGINYFDRYGNEYLKSCYVILNPKGGGGRGSGSSTLAPSSSGTLNSAGLRADAKPLDRAGLSEAANTAIEKLPNDAVLYPESAFDTKLIQTYPAFDTLVYGAPAAEITGVQEKYPIRYTEDNESKLIYWLNIRKVDAGEFTTYSDKELKEFASLRTGKGEDNPIKTFGSGGDYELRGGEKLYIHYTPSSTTDADGNEIKVKDVYLVYGAGTIIRGTLDAYADSEEVARAGIAYRKNTGSVTFDVVDADGKVTGTESVSDLGMFTLGANEQIEIRGLAQVKFNREKLGVSKIYLYKNFKNAELEGTTARVNPYSYILKDGEYLFYTDENKLETAYYGAGSEIILDGSVNIRASSDDTQIDVNDVLNEGLHLIPWGWPTILSGNDAITVREYQYVTLGAGDTLKTLRLKDSKTSLTNEWVSCWVGTDVTYLKASETEPVSLPSLSLADGTSWEVCTQMNLITAPNYPQILRRANVGNCEIIDRLTLYRDGDSIEDLTNSNPNSNPEVIEPRMSRFDYLPIAIRTAIPCLSDNGTVQLTDIAEESRPNSFIVQVTAPKSPAVVYTKPGNADPIVDYNTDFSLLSTAVTLIDDSQNITTKTWARFDFSYFNSIGDASIQTSDGVTKIADKALELPILLSPNTVGLLCIYIDPKTPEKTAWVETDVGTANSVLGIYNNVDSQGARHTWWSSESEDDKKYLKPGLNCIRIAKSCNLLVKSNSSTGSLLYDRLKLIAAGNGDAKTEGLNLGVLEYKALQPEATSEMAEQQLLDDLNKADPKHEFYYGVSVENSLAIELNEQVPTQAKMTNPAICYDTNNINRSFVVSKLDIDYLDTGLALARSSKL